MKNFSAYRTTMLYFTAAVFIFISANTFAQSPLIKKTTISLLADDGQNTSIKFETGDMIQRRVSTSQGDAVIISTDQGTPILKAGFPDLAKLTASIIIPDDKDMQVTVTSSNYTDYENVLVAPSKGTLTRNIDPSTIPYTFGVAYTENKFFPENLAELRDPYILRDFRGQTVIVYPFQYNPVTRTLRVYSDITVSVSPKPFGTGVNVLNRVKSADKVSSEFNHVYSNHFLNYSNGTRYTPLEEEGNMLIICYSSFMDAMQPFVDWKIQRGMKTEMVDVSTIGNDATSIKNYVVNYYNTKGLTFLLLVGDNAQVTSSSTTAGASDNAYGYILGDDHYQEIFVGRFSAESAAQVTTQVDRTLSYEKTPLIDTYYSYGAGLASEFGPGDDNEWDWQHEDNIRTELVNYNYSEIYELFNGTWSAANDAPGNPIATDLSNLVNTGIGIINYTGHGATTSIATTGFSNGNVNNLLTNTTRWPFLWIVGCEVGNFTSGTCFAEAWARATYNGQPSGGLASMMSTINQYWDEPMEGQDEMNLILTESYADNIKRTFGGISINGCFSMNDKYGNSGYDMTDTWTCFGDPSVYVRTTQPQDMTVSHDATILLGSSQFTVNCDADNTLASLTANGQILATATVSGGIATLSFDQLANVDTVTLTITGYNKDPYIAKIPAVAPAGPFVMGNSFTVNDVNGNNNGVADFNENVGLNAALQNVGLSTASSVTATIATTDPFITITDASQSYGDILSNAISTQNSAFAFTTADNVPDQHVALFACNMTDNASNTWASNFSVIMNAPVLGGQSFSIDDASGGNGDGFLDPGETAIITVYNTNTGHSNASNAAGSLVTSSQYITINSATYNVGDLNVGDNPTATFDVTVAYNAPYGITAPFTYSVTSGSYTGTFDFSTVIAPAIENFETNGFTQFDWQLGGVADWFTTSVDPFEGTYCSQSGDVSDNQSSTLQITLDVQFDDVISFAKRVSSEEGYDYLKFFIDGQLQDKWSGAEDWTTVSYPVTQGSHTFMWSYQKDGYFSSGLDCGWLDEIKLPAFQVNNSTGMSAQTETGNELNAYPNPFNHLTLISYKLGESANVSVKIYDVAGREMKQIADNENQSAGSYQIAFDGSKLPDGIYFCHVIVNGKIYVQKLIVNK